MNKKNIKLVDFNRALDPEYLKCLKDGDADINNPEYLKNSFEIGKSMEDGPGILIMEQHFGYNWYAWDGVKYIIHNTEWHKTPNLALNNIINSNLYLTSYIINKIFKIDEYEKKVKKYHEKFLDIKLNEFTKHPFIHGQYLASDIPEAIYDNCETSNVIILDKGNQIGVISEYKDDNFYYWRLFNDDSYYLECLTEFDSYESALNDLLRSEIPLVENTLSKIFKHKFELRKKQRSDY